MPHDFEKINRTAFGLFDYLTDENNSLSARLSAGRAISDLHENIKGIKGHETPEVLEAISRAYSARFDDVRLRDY